MKLEFQSRWLRLLIELFPAVPEIRRYRVVPACAERNTARWLRRRIARQLRAVEPEHTS
ncbi:MAG TPA: hypothetical protein VFY06_13185 [Verrucomicrobiae bacterium]|nr:hypothetical protein [Verrucomicrobiae bacterium]